VYIAAYHKEPETELGHQYLEKVSERFEVDHAEGLDVLDFVKGQLSIRVKVASKTDIACFLIASGSGEADVRDLNSIEAFKQYDEQVSALKGVLPSDPDFEYTLRLANAKNENDARKLLRRYLGDERCSLRSAGLIGNGILTTVERRNIVVVTERSREALFLSYGSDRDSAVRGAWALCDDVYLLATFGGEVSRLYSERRLMFDQMEASENSTQIRINEILAEMRRPVDEIQSSDLEEILKEITIQFSRLSTLSNTMRRDRVKAQSILRNTRALLKRWNERPFDDDNVTNSATEIDFLEGLIAPFADFIERIEALTAQFNTVLDSVRTYLGIRQQKMSLSEQTSSKEQLVQLVNLQETLHKLEVLIVAFYLTEMARIVFESLLPEPIGVLSINLLTAVFIPISLLISVLLSRMLHKGH
jgi:hypothetical protein